MTNVRMLDDTADDSYRLADHAQYHLRKSHRTSPSPHPLQRMQPAASSSTWPDNRFLHTSTISQMTRSTHYSRLAHTSVPNISTVRSVSGRRRRFKHTSRAHLASQLRRRSQLLSSFRHPVTIRAERARTTVPTPCRLARNRRSGNARLPLRSHWRLSLQQPPYSTAATSSRL